MMIAIPMTNTAGEGVRIVSRADRKASILKLASRLSNRKEMEEKKVFHKVNRTLALCKVKEAR